MSDVPFDDDDDQFDDYEIGGGHADGKTSKAIADEQSFPAIPIGRNNFFVKKVELKVDPENDNQVIFDRMKVYVPGPDGGPCIHEEAVTVNHVIVTWAMVDNPKMTLREYFDVLPGDVDEDEAEIWATCNTKEGSERPGARWNQFRHFLTGLGFDIEDGSVPPEARKFRNWKYWDDGEPRIVSLDIGTQMTKESNWKKPKLGANGEPYKQVNMFSHMRSEDTLIRLGEMDPPEDETAEDEDQNMEAADDTADDPEPEPEPAPPPRTAPKANPKPSTAPKTGSAPKTAPASKTAPKSAPPSKDGKSKLKF